MKEINKQFDFMKEGRCKIRLLNMDCQKFMKDILDNFYDLAIVDPPYGVSNAGETKKWDFIPEDKYFVELFRISKNQIIWGGNYFNLPHSESWICWDKMFMADIKGHALTNKGIRRKDTSDFELIWTSFKFKAKILRYTNCGNLNGFNMKLKVDYQQPKKIHPTQKSVALYEWLLLNYAKEGDKIIDTHGGSGSIVLAAVNMNYSIDWCELDKDYFKSAVKRIKKHISQLNLFNPEPILTIY